MALGVGGDLGRAAVALRATGLEWAASRHPRDLSSGERERLGLAAVAVSEPDLLVLDEPTRGVDPERKRELAAWLHGRTPPPVARCSSRRTTEASPRHRRVALGSNEVVLV